MQVGETYYRSPWRPAAVLLGLAQVLFAVAALVALIVVRPWSWQVTPLWTSALVVSAWNGPLTLWRAPRLGIYLADDGVRRMTLKGSEFIPFSEIRGVDATDEGYLRKPARNPPVRILLSDGAVRFRPLGDKDDLVRDIERRLAADPA